MQKKETIEFHRELVKDLLEFINKNAWNKQLSAQQMCYMSGYSIAYMHRIFRKTTGRSISEAIREKHFEHVKIALASSDKTITQIAKEHYYPTLCEFTRRFSKYCGMTPSEYRCQHNLNLIPIRKILAD